MRLKKPPLFAGLLILLMLLLSGALAQEVAMTYRLPGTVVVTASRLPMAMRQTGRRVVVWTAEEIAAQPASTLTEVLRTVGGVAAGRRCNSSSSS